MLLLATTDRMKTSTCPAFCCMVMCSLHEAVACAQVACCNIHFIDEGSFRINTSQTVACFKEDFSPADLPRKLSLCCWTLLPEFPEVLIVPDALQDIRCCF